MLIYHPAFDAYHCTFRFLALFEKCPSLEVDKARILDFYLAFPSAVSSIRLPIELSSARTIAKTYVNQYRDPVNNLRAFRDMQEIQLASLRCIAAAELIDPEKLQVGLIQRTDQSLPNNFRTDVTLFIERAGQITETIFFQLSKVPLFGPDGLKARTNLMEYRYDVI